jgi:hypothetical protein
MSFIPCDIMTSKSEIIQVAPITKYNYQSQYKNALSYPSWVLLENHKKHWDTADCVVSAQEAGEAEFPMKKTSRSTHHKRFRRVVIAGRPEMTLVNDNSYSEFVVGGRVVALVWDKSAITKLMEKALDNFHKSVEKNPYPNEDPVKMAFHFSRDFIVYCRDNFTFPPGAVIVRLENHPIKVETYTIRAYAPIQGYWASHPTIQPTPYGRGYDLEFLINNKKTEQCHQFLEWDNLGMGVFGGSGHIRWRLEETGNAVQLFNIKTTCPPTTNYQLSDCEWVVEKKEFHPPTETVYVRRTNRGMPLTALKRDEFKEELVMKVFHPDRVARLMGDTWGTEESWLNQI